MMESDPTTNNFSDPGVREVAGYRLLRRVGEGGMSTVYLSYDVAVARHVAVKLLADHLTQSPEFVTRFYREARLSRLLSHPNLVQGYAAGYDPQAAKHYLILEFIDGPSAHTVLSRVGCFPIGVVVQIGIHISRALAFLHSRHYVHRDVKPDNILLHPEGMAKLADLGLTKRLNDDPQLTAATQGVGTPYYMAYEQALNPALVDGRSDIFALGATLYHLLSGAVPYPGRTQEEVIQGMARMHSALCGSETPRSRRNSPTSLMRHLPVIRELVSSRLGNWPRHSKRQGLPRPFLRTHPRTNRPRRMVLQKPPLGPI